MSVARQACFNDFFGFLNIYCLIDEKVILAFGYVLKINSNTYSYDFNKLLFAINITNYNSNSNYCFSFDLWFVTFFVLQILENLIGITSSLVFKHE